MCLLLRGKSNVYLIALDIRTEYSKVKLGQLLALYDLFSIL